MFNLISRGDDCVGGSSGFVSGEVVSPVQLVNWSLVYVTRLLDE